MFRPGAVGALLDIYEQAILDLKKTIEDIPDVDLPVITDSQTSDQNCRSLQTILNPRGTFRIRLCHLYS